MVALQKADTNLDEVVNDVNNLVNCTHCHGPFFFFFFFFLFFSSCFCMCVFFVFVVVFFVLFFFFVLYLRYMNEREREGGGGGWRRERKKLYCNGWIHVNDLFIFKLKKSTIQALPAISSGRQRGVQPQPQRANHPMSCTGSQDDSLSTSVELSAVGVQMPRMISQP